MKKPISITLAALLVLLVGAGATVAWLTATDEVSNTFTVGKIAITLDEPNWDEDANKIYPGAAIDKDPTVTVAANSEDCYVYVMVDNQLGAAIPGAISLDIDTANWISVGASGTETVYRYKDIVDLDDAHDQELPEVFTTVTVDTDAVTEANIGLLNGKAIDVKAYAHQSNAITLADADEAALDHFGL